MNALPTLRRKILTSFWTVAFLYGVLGLVLALSVQIAGRTSPRMIHLNYDSIAAAGQMRDALTVLRNPQAPPEVSLEPAKKRFEAGLAFAKNNVTEPGEQEVVRNLEQLWMRSRGEGWRSENLRKFDELLSSLVSINEKGMFELAYGNEDLSQKVMIGAIVFFLLSLIASLFLADSLARRISSPLKEIAEALHRRPGIGRKLKLVEPNTLELLILTTELTRLWERVSESEKVNVREIVQQKTKLESVLESVDDALLVLDLDGGVTHVNQTLLELLALPISEISGRKWRDLSSMSDNYLKLRDTLSFESPEGTEIELVLRGAKHQYAARSRKISSPEGPVATLFLLHDISEKRQRERFRSDFIDLLSHEIKTPLQSLGTATELLSGHKQTLPESLQPLVETIFEDVERIKAVANEFVQVTQSHSKILKLKIERLPLSQLIQEWIKPFQVVAKDRGVKVAYRQEGSEVIWAGVDQVKFPWVVSNLLSNAIRFSPPGSEVGVILTDRNGAVEILVKDSGPGVPEAERSRIFEPFFQGAQGSRGLFGVGLTIAREVVEAHDGRIDYYPRHPQGSEFKITLPFPPF